MSTLEITIVFECLRMKCISSHENVPTQSKWLFLFDIFQKKKQFRKIFGTFHIYFKLKSDTFRHIENTVHTRLSGFWMVRGSIFRRFVWDFV